MSKRKHSSSGGQGRGKKASSMRTKASSSSSGSTRICVPPPKFKLTNRVDEEHKKAIYSVQFNFVDHRHRDIFATIGANRATVYQCREDGVMEPIATYQDADEEEQYYTCTWSVNDATGAPLLLVARSRGVIKVIDCHTQKMLRSLVGHGNDINELRTHPKDCHIILSVSKDQSIRLWNISTGICLAVLAGDNGHREDVLSGDFHLSGLKLVSCGMDHSVKIWDLEPLQESITRSYAHDLSNPKEAPFVTKVIQFPIFSTSKVHNNYVDSVRWYGDFILSKSVSSVITLWKPRMERKKQSSGIVRLRELKFADCGIWYIRFCLDYPQKLVACGNKTGTLWVWRLDDLRKDPVARRLAHVKSGSVVRQVALSYDGSTLLAGCDNASLWRWDQI